MRTIDIVELKRILEQQSKEEYYRYETQSPQYSAIISITTGENPYSIVFKHQSIPDIYHEQFIKESKEVGQRILFSDDVKVDVKNAEVRFIYYDIQLRNYMIEVLSKSYDDNIFKNDTE